MPLSPLIEPYSNTMDIHINQKPLSLPEGATVADALAAYGARPPYAVALNGDFVARTQHAARALQPGDGPAPLAADQCVKGFVQRLWL